MNKIENKLLCLLGRIVCIVLFLVTCWSIIKDGYARDAGICVTHVISCALWITLFVCAFSFTIFSVFDRQNNNFYIQVICKVLLITLIVGGILVNA